MYAIQMIIAFLAATSVALPEPAAVNTTDSYYEGAQNVTLTKRGIVNYGTICNGGRKSTLQYF
jgi:hypothetical protein